MRREWQVINVDAGCAMKNNGGRDCLTRPEAEDVARFLVARGYRVHLEPLSPLASTAPEAKSASGQIPPTTVCDKKAT